MELVNYLASVWGISIVIVSLAVLFKPNYLKLTFAGVEKEATMFNWGVISLVLGVATVLAYNVWGSSWQVIITIIGWLALLKGIAILFAPEQIKKWAKKIENAPFLPYAVMVLLLIGLILTYLGFTTQQV